MSATDYLYHALDRPITAALSRAVGLGTHTVVVRQLWDELVSPCEVEVDRIVEELMDEL